MASSGVISEYSSSEEATIGESAWCRFYIGLTDASLEMAAGLTLVAMGGSATVSLLSGPIGAWRRTIDICGESRS